MLLGGDCFFLVLVDLRFKEKFNLAAECSGKSTAFCEQSKAK